MICPICHTEKNVIKLDYTGTHAEGRRTTDGVIGSYADETTYYKCTQCNGFITYNIKIIDGTIERISNEYSKTDPSAGCNTHA